MKKTLIQVAVSAAMACSVGAVALTLGETNAHMWADVIAHIDSKDQEFAITPVGQNRLLFTRRAGDDMTILETVRGHNGYWSKPVPASFAAADDADPFFDPYTSTLYYMSRASHPAKAEGADDYDIWRVDWTGSNWGTPEPLGPGVNTADHEVFPSLDKDGTLYFASNRKSGYGGHDIYLAEIHGGKWRAENAGPVVNSSESDSNPLILPDGKTLIYYSKRGGGYGEADLYQITGGPGAWSEAQNLGMHINGPDGDFAPSILDAATFVYTQDKKLRLMPFGRALR